MQNAACALIAVTPAVDDNVVKLTLEYDENNLNK